MMAHVNRPEKVSRSPRRKIGTALFAAGVALLIAGPWLARSPVALASCLAGGIVLFALADVIAPLPD
jgi:hypothetical protein